MSKIAKPHCWLSQACVAAWAALSVAACGGSEGTPPESPQGSGSTGLADADSGSASSTGVAGTGGLAGVSGGASASSTSSSGGSTGGTPGSTGSTEGATSGSTGAGTAGTPTSSGGSGGVPVIGTEGCGDVSVDAAQVDHAAAGRIVVLGSSTAAGQNASSPDKAWVGLYRTYLAESFPNFTLENLGVAGFNTYRIQANDYVPPAGRPTPAPGNNITTALEKEPDAIIINLPSNDQAEGFSLTEQMDNYERVAALAEERGVLVWVTTSQPRDFASVEQRQSLMDTRDAIQQHFAPRAVDFWTNLANADGTIHSSYNSDGTHLNDAGHALLAQRVTTCAIPEVILTSGE